MSLETQNMSLEKWKKWKVVCVVDSNQQLSMENPLIEITTN